MNISQGKNLLGPLEANCEYNWVPYLSTCEISNNNFEAIGRPHIFLYQGFFYFFQIYKRCINDWKWHVHKLWCGFSLIEVPIEDDIIVIKEITSEEINELVRICLRSTNFIFHGDIYEQTNGCNGISTLAYGFQSLHGVLWEKGHWFTCPKVERMEDLCRWCQYYLITWKRKIG